MRYPLRFVFPFLLLFLGFPTVGAVARRDAEAPRIHLVQSVPEGTDLDEFGVAYAKETWIQMIRVARVSIDIEQMYVSGNAGTASSTNEVVAALEAASARGVQIRLVLAKAMIETDPVLLDRLRKIPTLRLAVIDLKKVTGGIQHAKFWIVDGREIFVGSQNFDYLALTQIHEIGVRIVDATVAERLRAVFELDWKIAEKGIVPVDVGVAPATPPGSVVELVASPPALNPRNIRGGLDALRELLRNAKKTIAIQVMEYSTFSGRSTEEWRAIDDEIRAAARRGVKVRLLVSHWNTEKPAVGSIQSLALAKNVEVKICTVPDLGGSHTPYSRLIHSKYMTIDDEVVWVGTSNWSKGYFDATRGIEIILRRPDLVAAANRIYERVWSAPYSAFVDPTRTYPKPIK